MARAPQGQHARTATPALPALRRLLAAMLATLQLLLVTVPLLDRDLGESAQVHVEEQGVQLHWSHDTAECAGCAHRHLTAAPAPPQPDMAAATIAALPVPASPVAAAAGPTLSRQHSRAPPSVS